MGVILMCDSALANLLEEFGALQIRIAGLRAAYQTLQKYRKHPNYCMWELAMTRRAAILRTEQVYLIRKLHYGVY